jgi:hypothetical protein
MPLGIDIVGNLWYNVDVLRTNQLNEPEFIILSDKEVLPINNHN